MDEDKLDDVGDEEESIRSESDSIGSCDGTLLDDGWAIMPSDKFYADPTWPEREIRESRERERRAEERAQERVLREKYEKHSATVGQKRRRSS